MESKLSGYPGGGGGFPGGPYGGPYGAAGYGGYPGSENFPPPPPPGASRPSNFHTISLGLLVFLPSLIFLGISLGYALLYHQMPALCWSFTAICFCLSAMFMMASPAREGRPRYWFNLGSLCLLATMTANVVGQWNMNKHFGMYWAYEGQREYSEVSPSEPALSHLDAGKITFDSEARIDFSAAAGLAEGSRYCVAPIVGKSDKSTKEIQYWAAGVDCCGQAGNFTCDDVGNKNAHAGLVYLDYGSKVGHLEKFRRAAREAGAAHGLSPSQDALFLAWVEDPEVAQHMYWKWGMGFLAGGSLAYLGISVVVGIMLHFGRPASSAAKNKLASRSL